MKLQGPFQPHQKLGILTLLQTLEESLRPPFCTFLTVYLRCIQCHVFYMTLEKWTGLSIYQRGIFLIRLPRYIYLDRYTWITHCPPNPATLEKAFIPAPSLCLDARMQGILIVSAASCAHHSRFLAHELKFSLSSFFPFHSILYPFPSNQRSPS